MLQNEGMEKKNKKRKKARGERKGDMKRKG
jgi:hypothetical protein